MKYQLYRSRLEVPSLEFKRLEKDYLNYGIVINTAINQIREDMAHDWMNGELPMKFDRRSEPHIGKEIFEVGFYVVEPEYMQKLLRLANMVKEASDER